MFKARDIMDSKVICVRPEMPLYEAIRLVTRSNLSSLPVVDENLKLVGILSEKDVLQLLYDTKDNPLLKVEDFMRTDIISYNGENSIIDLCDCLLVHSFRRIPIVQEGVLIGIVSRTNVIESILKLKHQQNKGKMAS
jgi:CBS domain-containing protein